MEATARSSGAPYSLRPQRVGLTQPAAKPPDEVQSRSKTTDNVPRSTGTGIVTHDKIGQVLDEITLNRYTIIQRMDQGILDLSIRQQGQAIRQFTLFVLRKLRLEQGHILLAQHGLSEVIPIAAKLNPLMHTIR